jgi:hypothetical protein
VVERVRSTGAKSEFACRNNNEVLLKCLLLLHV